MQQTRRQFLKEIFEIAGKTLAGGAFLWLISGCAKPSNSNKIKSKVNYKIDTKICTACGNCADACNRPGNPAIQATNDLEVCGFCRHCPAYFIDPENDSEDPSNLLCKSNAVRRKFISEYRYEYTIDPARCQGCGVCVLACKKQGSKSLSLYINQDICLHCETCSAQKSCPNNAFLPA